MMVVIPLCDCNSLVSHLLHIYQFLFKDMGLEEEILLSGLYMALLGMT